MLVAGFSVVTVSTLAYLLTSKRFKHGQSKQELSELNRLRCEQSNANQERKEFQDFLQEVNVVSALIVDGLGDCDKWESEFCKSIIRNAPKLQDARIQNTQDTFVHAISLLRSNFRNIEMNYFNKSFVKYGLVTQQSVYDCLDGDKEAILMMFKNVASKCMEKKLQVELSSRNDLSKDSKYHMVAG